MAIVALLLLLLFLNIAVVTPTSSLATGWQDEQAGGNATGKAWLHNKRSKGPSGRRGTAEPGEVLVKRTSGSSWNGRLSPHLQGTGLQSIPHNRVHQGAPLAPHLLGNPGLSTATPFQVQPDAHSAPHTEPGSSGKRTYKANRHPAGLSKSNPALKALALRGTKARTRAKYGRLTIAEARAAGREYSRRWRESLSEDQKIEVRARKAEQTRRCYERQKQDFEACQGLLSKSQAEKLEVQRSGQGRKRSTNMRLLIRGWRKQHCLQR